MTVPLPPEFWTDYSGAIFGGLNRTYRYLLWRRWSPKSQFDSARLLVTVMLNPSTADWKKDDPTIRRLSAIAKEHRFDGIVVLNLFAFRATNPEELYGQVNPAGPDNMAWLEAVLAGVPTDRVLVAWGALKTTTPQRKALKVLEHIRNSGKETVCLLRTMNGYPKHPLYCPTDSGLRTYHGSHEDEQRLADAKRAPAGGAGAGKGNRKRRAKPSDHADRNSGNGRPRRSRKRAGDGGGARAEPSDGG